jgi:N6-adenosine-specific RNA methylase IME4
MTVLQVPEEFGTIVVDVPWREQGGCGRGTKYRTIRNVAEAAAVILRSPAWRPAATCHLYMWQTVDHYEEPDWLIGVLDFRRVSAEVWVKTTKTGKRLRGMGQYRRHCAEFTLIAVRGPTLLPAPADRLDSVYEAPPGSAEHSAKPDEFYARCERTSPGPRVDIFARRRRRGWWTWGDQLGPDLQPPEEDLFG